MDTTLILAPSMLQLQKLMATVTIYMDKTPLPELEYKPAPSKWSKKEILGHLIDSALHNLQRFNEIQFEAKPYKVRKYRQDDFVIANQYQQADLESLVHSWTGLNLRILHVMGLQTAETLAFELITGDNEARNLEFLMVDYVDHLAHHVLQITA